MPLLILSVPLPFRPQRRFMKDQLAYQYWSLPVGRPLIIPYRMHEQTNYFFILIIYSPFLYDLIIEFRRHWFRVGNIQVIVVYDLHNYFNQVAKPSTKNSSSNSSDHKRGIISNIVNSLNTTCPIRLAMYHQLASSKIGHDDVLQWGTWWICG